MVVTTAPAGVAQCARLSPTSEQCADIPSQTAVQSSNGAVSILSPGQGG